MDWGKVIEELHEARRYAWSNPIECQRQVSKIMERLRERAEASSDEGESDAIGRLVQNLAVGSFFAVVSATTFAGYISGAAFEITARSWAVKGIGREVATHAEA